MSTLQTMPAPREFSFTDKDFRFLAGLANSETGIVLPQQKKDMVYGRLARRLRALGLESFADYCDLLQSAEGADEICHLINAVTTNLTSFFRESHHFSHLAEEVLKPLATTKEARRIRVWSAACSSGMEPYSLAMTMRQAIPDINRWDARILATDIDSNMLQIGSRGEYNSADVDSVPAGCKTMVHNTKPGKVLMPDELKKLIAFRQLNLLETWPFKGPFDAVFCRNVVIYFDKETKIKLFARMAEVIKPGGWLYIGHSENLHGITDRFQLVGRTIYRRMK